MHGFEGQVEGGLAFESGERGDAFDRGGQVRTISEELGGMLDAQRIAVQWKGYLKFLVEAFRDALLGDIERNGELVLGKFLAQIGLCLFDVGND